MPGYEDDKLPFLQHKHFHDTSDGDESISCCHFYRPSRPQWTAYGTTGDPGELAAHRAAEAPNHAQGLWEHSPRTEVPPVKDHLTKAKAATTNVALVW